MEILGKRAHEVANFKCCMASENYAETTITGENSGVYFPVAVGGLLFLTALHWIAIKVDKSSIDKK